MDLDHHSRLSAYRRNTLACLLVGSAGVEPATCSLKDCCDTISPRTHLPDYLSGYSSQSHYSIFKVLLSRCSVPVSNRLFPRILTGELPLLQLNKLSFFCVSLYLLSSIANCLFLVKLFFQVYFFVICSKCGKIFTEGPFFVKRPHFKIPSFIWG